MIPFLKQAQNLLKDRQVMTVELKKVGDDIVAQFIPDAKGKARLFDITIPAEDLNRDDIDHLVFGELQKPAVEEKAKFQVSESDAPEKEDDDDEEEKPAKEDKKADTKRPSPKPAAKKETPKKSATKETVKEPEVKEDPVKEDKVEGPVSRETKSEKTKSVKKEKVKQPALDLEQEEEQPTDDKQEPAKETEAAPAPEPKEETQQPPIQRYPSNGDDDEIFNGLMDEGKKFHDERSYKEAIASFEAALKIKPEEPKAVTALNRSKLWLKAAEKVATTS